MGNEKRESFISLEKYEKGPNEKGEVIRHDVWHVKNTSKVKFLKEVADSPRYNNEAAITYMLTEGERDTRSKIRRAIYEMDALKGVDIIWDTKFTISYEVNSEPFMKEFRGIIVE